MRSTMVRMNAILLAILILSGLSATAQQVQRLTLSATDRFPIAGESPSVIDMPLVCDADGNIYEHPYALRSGSVVKISADGKSSVMLSLATVPGFESADFDYFAVDYRGQVYVLSSKAKERKAVLLIFGSDGQYDSTVEFAGYFLPEHVAVFRSGEFLVGGYEMSEKDHRPTGKPFTGIFNRGGQLITQLQLPNDFEGSSQPTDKQKPARLDPIISLSHAVGADDGYVYLMRPMNPAVIYVVSADGSVVHEFKIAPPGEGFKPETIEVAGGRLALEFYKSDLKTFRTESLIALVDAFTGERLADYVPSSELGTTMVCYSPNGFTFMATDSNKREVLVQAKP